MAIVRRRPAPSPGAASFNYLGDRQLPSLTDLRLEIERFVEGWNQHPQPFIWTATADSIFAKLERLPKTLDPAPDGGGVQIESALGHHGHPVRRAQPIGQLPASTRDD